MYTIDPLISDTVEERLKSDKIINIKIPSDEPFTNYSFISGYDIYYYDDLKKEIKVCTPKISSIIKMCVWLIKLALFVLQNVFVFPIAPMTVATLSFEILGIGLSFIKKNDKFDSDFLRAVSKHIKIRNKPSKKIKKVKKLVYVCITENTSIDTYNSVLFLCDLIEKNYVRDTGVVIISKVELRAPQQILLKIEKNEEDNHFINDFNRNILDSIRNENYNNVSALIKELLVKRGITNPTEFEFIMQCLAFSYKNLDINNFKNQFLDTTIQLQDHLDNGIKNKFIEDNRIDPSFFKFCYKYLLQYYHNKSAVSFDLSNKEFKIIIKNINKALISKNEYYIAAQFCSKFCTLDESIDNYIIAYLHSKYVKNTINDECYTFIEKHSASVPRADLFVRLLKLNLEETPCLDTVEAIGGQIMSFDNISPLLRLCFYYYLVNPIYISDGCSEEFLEAYCEALDQLDDNETLKCLFGAQFLLLYTTIEDMQIHTKYAKRVSLLLKYVLCKNELLADKQIYLKICRSINGLRIDRFDENLKLLKKIENFVKYDYGEEILYNLNLGAMYILSDPDGKGACRSALRVYRKVDKNMLKSMANCIDLTYKNNLEIIKYFNQPSKQSALESYKRLNKCLAKLSPDIATEEVKHLHINRLIFAIIGELSENVIAALFQQAENKISSDNYFKFYLQQAKLLYGAVYGKEIDDEIITQSVFFLHKKAFFQQKCEILKSIGISGGMELKDINAKLKNDLSCFDNNYDYFKHAEMFSLIERWYE